MLQGDDDDDRRAERREGPPVADRGYVLELGRNRFEGPGLALLGDPEVKRLYLGGSDDDGTPRA